MSKLTDRLRELSDAITQGREATAREFTMRIPAEPERDADLVLAKAAKLIDSYETRLGGAEDLIRQKLREGRCGIHWGDRAEAWLEAAPAVERRGPKDCSSLRGGLEETPGPDKSTGRAGADENHSPSKGVAVDADRPLSASMMTPAELREHKARAEEERGP